MTNKHWNMFGVVLYNHDGSHHLWFQNSTMNKTLKEFINWRDSINGEILLPSFQKIMLVNRRDQDFRLDLTTIIK
jgi:hypothetical protein